MPSDGTVRVNTWYAGTLSGKVEPGAQAFLVHMETPNTVLRAHFHDVGQYQIFFDGSGLLGSAPIGPMTVFYTDAYASYGPIIAGDEGISFFTLRQDHDEKVHFMPEDRALRKPSVGRRTVMEFDPADEKNVAASKAVGQLVRDVVADEEDGMRCEFVVAGPHTSLAEIFDDAPPRSYVVVLAGQVVADGVLLRERGMLYSEDVTEPSVVATEDKGVMLTVMTFPPSHIPREAVA
jgi:hypothetical protein